MYALDARAAAAAAVTYSLLLARARAGQALSTEYRPRQQAFDRSVVGSVTLRGDLRIGEPRALVAAHSPNGSAHVVFRLDGLTLRIYDRAALDMYAKAWVDAHEAAQNAFGVGHVPSIQTLLHRASQQSRTPYRLDALSMGETSASRRLQDRAFKPAAKPVGGRRELPRCRVRANRRVACARERGPEP